VSVPTVLNAHSVANDTEPYGTNVRAVVVTAVVDDALFRTGVETLKATLVNVPRRTWMIPAEPLLPPLWDMFSVPVSLPSASFPYRYPLVLQSTVYPVGVVTDAFHVETEMKIMSPAWIPDGYVIDRVAVVLVPVWSVPTVVITA